MRMKGLLTLVFCLIYCLLIGQGNVGVGTTNPSQKLDVAGNIKSDTAIANAIKIPGNAAAGKVLTSNASGVGTWQPLSTSSSSEEDNVGFGAWGDCSTNALIGDYYVVSDTNSAPFENYGFATAIYGDYAVVGNMADSEIFSFQGSATVYHFDNGAWNLVQKLTDPNAGTEDLFGTSVAISANFLFVGASFDDETFADQGSVTVFELIGGQWVWKQKLVDPTGATNDGFGYSVSVSGNYLLVGAWFDDAPAVDQGSASFFSYNGSSWVFHSKVTDATGAAYDNFGTSVSLSGNRAIVGASSDDVGSNSDQGSASIYHLAGSSWVFAQKISDAQGGGLDYFGRSVDIAGNYAVVGVPSDDINANSGQGSMCIYKYNGASWVLQQKTWDPAGGFNEIFGNRVQLAYPFILVGSPQDNIGSNTQQGSVSLYRQVGASWQRIKYFLDPSGVASDQFGHDVAVDPANKRFIIGAQGFDGGRGKCVFGKIK